MCVTNSFRGRRLYVKNTTHTRTHARTRTHTHPLSLARTHYLSGSHVHTCKHSLQLMASSSLRARKETQRYKWRTHAHTHKKIHIHSLSLSHTHTYPRWVTRTYLQTYFAVDGTVVGEGAEGDSELQVTHTRAQTLSPSQKHTHSLSKSHTHTCKRTSQLMALSLLKARKEALRYE